MPRSRRSILAAALALPRSRFFSAKGEVAAAVGGGTGVVGAAAGAWVLFGVAVCLLTTRAASRAALSTMIACALRLSGDWALIVFAGDLFSEAALAVACGSLVDCLVCLVVLGLVVATAASLPLFAFLSFKNWIRGVVDIFSLLLPSGATR